MYDIQRWQQWLTKSAKHAGGVQQGTAEETWEEEVFLATASVSMWPCKNISHIEVLVINFFSNPTHKTETGTASRGDTTNTNPQVDQSNDLPNQKQHGAVNKYDLTVFIRLESSTACPELWKAVHVFRVLSVFQWVH
jgi:hypothetical protein